MAKSVEIPFELKVQRDTDGSSTLLVRQAPAGFSALAEKPDLSHNSDAGTFYRGVAKYMGLLGACRVSFTYADAEN